MHMRPLTAAAGFFVLVAALVQVAPPAQLGHGAVSPSNVASGIPQWPWLPGGVTWSPGAFAATPYPVKQVNDSNLPQGQRLVVTPGTEGTVLKVGSTKASIAAPTPATVATGTAPVHTLKIHGVTYHYDRVMSMMTTAYNASIAMNGPSGAVAAWNGKPLQHGDVAVDPGVIPLGTYLYIDGYGPARAVDTGSAIFGDHIDLFFNESSFLIALYGIQFHKVYILTGPPPHFNA